MTIEPKTTEMFAEFGRAANQTAETMRSSAADIGKIMKAGLQRIQPLLPLPAASKDSSAGREHG